MPSNAALISLVTGIDVNQAILIIVSISVIYSLISGFKASILTDCLEMLIIYSFIFTVVPNAIVKMGGIDTVLQNLGGIGNHINIFDLKTIIYFAIPTFVTLWTGPVTDQMFYQRVMGSKEGQVRKSFISASFFYIIVPFSLSLLGFLGVQLFNLGNFQIYDEQLIGGMVVSALFSKTVICFYCIMILSGLCSTIDSALCAASSVGCIDIYKTYLASSSHELRKKHLLLVSRLFMLLVTAIGIFVAFSRPSLIAMFFIIGTVRAAGFFPTILALKTNKMPACIIPLAIGSAICVCLPLSIYANINNEQNLIVVSSLGSVFCPLMICLGGMLYYQIKNKFKNSQ